MPRRPWWHSFRNELPSRISGSEPGHGLVGVVRPATEGDVPNRRLASQRPGVDVMELQATALVAAPAVPGRERAAAAVALPDCTPDMGRNVTRPRSRRADLPLRIRSAQLLPFQLLPEQRERPGQDLARIAVGLVPH